MMESAARAERFEMQASSDRWYTWEVPQKPVTAKISLTVIDRLEREAVERFRSLSSTGSEIGGVLLGRVTMGDPHIVTVEDFIALPCDYSRGPLYRLSETDMARFRPTMERQPSGDAAVPVGFFRSHTRKGLSLDADDVAVMDALFSSPYHIALVIRPFATKASVAGIFIRENGSVQTESSYLEFPFRSTMLEGAKPEPPPAKVPPRAQIVPIASRREIALESFVPPEPVKEVHAEPVMKTPVLEPAPVMKVEAPKAEPKPEAVKVEAVKAELPKPEAVKVEAVKVEPVKVEPAKVEAAQPEAAKSEAAKSETVKVEAAKPEPAKAVKVKTELNVEVVTAPVRPTPEPATEPVREPFRSSILDEEAPAKSNKILYISLGAIVPLLAVILLFVYPGWMRQKPAAPQQTVADHSPLELRVERTGNEILLTWKPDSPGVSKAAQAVLAISDGPQQENVTLDITQFRSGRVVYSPATSDVVFRMEVSGQGGAKIASESLRVLGSRPSAFDAANAANAAAAKTPVAGQVAPTTPETVLPPAEEVATPKKVVPLRPFNTESLSQRLRAAGPSDLPDAPLVTKTETAAPAISLNLGTSAPIPPPPVVSTSTPVATPTEPAAAAGAKSAKVIPAELIRRITPEYPKMARDSGVKGVVEVKARVGADGKVKAIESVIGPTMLQKPAVDAVRQWLYKPTMLNGEPVESETLITLRFGAN